ncbi:hypothetical protein CVT25_010767 [Psilocybe cyanescens]|uniref:Uncharacterized protein n=1 Tax=Psilocybe cyanescens TaxID=93625 RepID=A0A409XA95_PSICY|nr:hypothetical protein CVT25_010767 [Psilocybe cyanescens]
MDIYGARLPTSSTDDTGEEHGTDTGPDINSGTAAEMWLRLALLIEEKQIEIQDKVRRLGSAPRDQDQQIVMQLRQALTMMLAELKTQQQHAGVHDIQCGRPSMPLNSETEYDDIEENPDIPGGPAMQDHSVPEDHNPPTPTILSVERQILSLPSNHNVSAGYEGLEMELRKQQARNHITRIRDIVADISFLYQYMVKRGTRTSIRSNGQKKVKSLNHDKVLHARIYSACRSRLVALGCDQEFLSIFCLLTRNDLKASTAIWKPNLMGSSTLELLWIWRTG